MARSGGQLLADGLLAAGVEHIFGVPAWQLDHAVDGIARTDGRIRFLTTRHEQAAAYMADGYARSSDRAGVLLVGPGPALLNATAGLSSAHACSAPLLCLAGQVPSPTIGRGLGMHHEIPDQAGVLDGLTKARTLVCDPGAIAVAVRDGLAHALAPRQRPVAVELPPDVLAAVAGEEADRDRRPSPPAAAARDEAGRDGTPGTPAVDPALLAEAAALLRAAQRPAIYAGCGVQASGAMDELRRIAELLQAPVVMSDNGRGALSDRHPLALTALGGRVALAHVDAVLVVGSRFLDGAGEPVAATAGRALIHVNADARDLGAPRQPMVALHADARPALAALAELLADGPVRPVRHDEVRRVRAWCDEQLAALEPQLSWVRALRAAIPEDGILVPELTQVGYAAQLAYPVYGPRTFLTSGYAGILGYGYPTALGAAVANPGRAVVSINGDGGFGFCLQELATARLHEIPVIAVVFDDGGFGNVRRTQRERFDGRELGAELANPDFVALAQAFGVQATRADTPDALRSTLAAAIADRRPALIAVPVGAMPSPWHLVHEHVPAPRSAPPDPLAAEARA